ETVRVFDFRGALPETGGSTVERLGPRALPARDRLVRHLDGRDGERPAAAGAVPLRGSRARLRSRRGQREPSGRRTMISRQ
ncbi:MAG TPA: hypothetical protein VGJ70_16695, partial [Solirubrobacteraceae bacterium]